MDREAVYIGDGVYAELHDDMILTYTSDGISKSNETWWEPSTLAHLVAFANRHSFLVEQA